MPQDTNLFFDADTALNAALYSAKYQLALADSLILQIIREHHATLWTQDVYLKEHQGLQYKAKIYKP